MALEVTNLEREFKFQKNGQPITLPDPDPNMSAAEVLQFHSNQYPELTTASPGEPKIVDNKAIYSVKTTVGTKG